MLDVLDQDFVRTTRAKGLSERRAILHHVFRNALLPMITLAGLELPALLSPSFISAASSRSPTPARCSPGHGTPTRKRCSRPCRSSTRGCGAPASC